jgi:hypothetical protein
VLRFRLMIKRGLNETATSIRKVKRNMKYYAGLDVSVKETSVCIVDESGNVCREKKVISHPDDLVAVLSDPAFNFERIGLEAGPLSQWLFEGLAKAGFAVLCIETRHTKAFLKAQQPNKSDRNDARGIAHMMRVGLFKDVHVKTLTSQKRRALLTARKLLQEKAIAMENDMRGLLRNFGLKVGTIRAFKFDQRIRELVEAAPDLTEIIEPLLAARATRGVRQTGPQGPWRGQGRSGLSAVDDGARSRTDCRARLYLDNRHSVPLSAFASGGGCIGADARTQPVGREQTNRSCLVVRRCHAAGASL